MHPNTSLVITPQDTRPARHILHLDFNHFRAIGMRRSVGEAAHGSAVTGERLLLALKVGPVSQCPSRDSIALSIGNAKSKEIWSGRTHGRGLDILGPCRTAFAWLPSTGSTAQVDE